MSDKSFGDHANRNIVKNPLLSTAVTGLSLQDLTHNAVLVPVAPNQGLITRSDNQSGPVTPSLGHTEHEIANIPSGDSNSNIISPHPSIPTQSSSTYSHITPQDDKNTNQATVTVSKASNKSEDDFDVSEYFARLQGTRYVSAPLNSHPDQNANVATEENLEEINLNDDKQIEVQQSLTADIAQNFSQLPTVLPHVASAVFSSFSNMLSLKSREQTPDGRTAYDNYGGQGHVTSNRPYQEVQMSAVSQPGYEGIQGYSQEVKEVVPPPREPPITGTSNYRITTRKKYAQIPGLSSGAPQQIAFNPLAQNVPSYFTPTLDNNDITQENNAINKEVDKPIEVNKQNENYNILNPVETLPSNTQFNINLPASEHQPYNLNIPKDNEPHFFETASQTQVIPPPPMFSTQRRDSRDSSSHSGKSVLPPSVARRIGSNNPVMKQQTYDNTVPSNIFVPTFDPIVTPEKPSEINYGSPNVPDSNIGQIASQYLPGVPSSQILQQQITPPLTLAAPPMVSMGSSLTKPPTSFAPPQSTSIAPLPASLPPTSNKLPSAISSGPPGLIQPPIGVMPPTTNLPPPPKVSQTFAKPPPMMPPSTAMTPNIFVPTIPTDVTPDVSQSGAPISFGPETSVPPALSQSSFDPNVGTSSFFTSPAPPIFNPASITEPQHEPPKPLVEPPKATGNINFRLNKKRPQYYSGPIEGVGAISNSIKPVIAPVDSGSFHGAVFTPDKVQTDHNVPAAIPFDLSQQTEPPQSYPQIDSANAVTAQTTATFDISQQPYGQFDTPNIAQNYGQPVNMAFDMSRPITDNYETREEPKESRGGFGIIGSLKSKLSNLDINKIQHSVTTFFDPAYNDTKKDAPSTYDNASYGQPLQAQGTQNNFEIFVSEVQQNTQTYNYSAPNTNAYYQDQYYQTNYPNNYQQDVNFSYYSANPYAETAPATVYQPTESNIYTPSNVEPTNVNEPPKLESDSALILDSKESNNDKELEDVPIIEPEETKTFQTITSIEEKSAVNFFDLTNLHTQGIKLEEDIKDNIVTSQDNFKIDTFVEPTNVIEHPKLTDIFGEDNSQTTNVFHENMFSGTDCLKEQHIENDHSYLKEDTKKFQETVKESMPEDAPVLGISSNPQFGATSVDVSEKNFSVKDQPTSGPENVVLINRIFENIESLNAEYSEPKSINMFNNNTDMNLFDNLGSSMRKKDELNDIIDPTYTEIVSDSDTSGGILDRMILADKSAEACDISKDVVLDRKASIGTIGGSRNPTGQLPVLSSSPPDMEALKDSIPYIVKEPVGSKNDGAENKDVIQLKYEESNKLEDEEISKAEKIAERFINNLKISYQPFSGPQIDASVVDTLDSAQYDEISHTISEEISNITEDTIENIHKQSATEMLDMDTIANYGWSKDYSSTDYSFKIDPNTIGFYGSNSLFFDNPLTMACDEVKANVFNQEHILTRQMSIPSAPPQEDDQKSDEAGVLDVQSIEQDAKKDFPIYEECNFDSPDKKDTVNKIEDTLSSLISKSKILEDIVEQPEHKPVLFDMPSQPISMASYLDTGNYAADTHYKNTMTSPSHISIPPGFEEEFKKRLALAKQKEEGKQVPDTSSQTNSTSVTTYSIAKITGTVSYTSSQRTVDHNIVEKIVPVGFNVESNVAHIVEDSPENLPDISPVFQEGKDEVKAPIEVPALHAQDIATNKDISLFTSTNQHTDEMKTQSALNPEFSQKLHEKSNDPIIASMFTQNSNENLMKRQEKPSQIMSMFGQDTDQKEKSGKLVFQVGQKIEDTPKLPDPLNFFSEPAPVNAPESLNRLASYFSSPPKTDHAKSFFELSQSQNHYRHATTEDEKKYASLIKDLTSVQNITIPAQQNIRHVNYFTIEYDQNIQDGDTNNVKKMAANDNDTDNDKTTIDKIVTNCRYCTKQYFDNQLKVKKSMNDNSSSEPGNSNDLNEKNMNDNTNQNHKNSITINFGENEDNHQETNQDGAEVLSENRASGEYVPVKHHWFYRLDVEEKSIWRGFSVVDSKALETAYLSPDLNMDTLVATDGGRFDVNVVGRLRIPVYWNDKPTNVRRCSWFYKGTTDARYVPYTEPIAGQLEEEYRRGITTGDWHRRLALPSGEVVVMHGPAVMVHFLNSDALFSTPSLTFGKRVYRNPVTIRVSRDQPDCVDHLLLLVHGAGEYSVQKEKDQSTSRPRVVRRGHDEDEIEDPEPSGIDHLLMLCHGVGSACDMRFRSVEEVVEDFRSTSLQLIQSHYRNSYDQGIVSRVEVLPISWHSTLHSGETGVDRRLAQITLDSIPRLRNFTNDTVLDVLFYTSPVFCQTILDTVCKELNRIYSLFMSRNPNFKGGVSLGGHSLGSVILYDLLCHQEDGGARKADKTYVSMSDGGGQSSVRYSQLSFRPDALYALGSPIAMFESIRGVESLGLQFCLPTCTHFFNIFHPYDPIAYRVEPLINPQLRDLPPYLIPHHKGRKRMHLELKDTMARVGADIKQKVFDSLRSTWNKWKAQPTEGQLEKVVEEDIEKEQLCEKEKLAREEELSTPEMLGRLNEGRRVDYVLQEAPLEMINEYLFAMSSHVGYWESEDTMLLILREIYSALGVQPDCHVPPPNMSVTRTKDMPSMVVNSRDSPSTSQNYT